MSATVAETDLDLKNILAAEQRQFDRDPKHGWFMGGAHSYDDLLRFKVVRDWIDTYTSKNTRRQKLYQLEKVLAAAKIKDPTDLLKITDAEAKSLIKRVSQFYLQQG